MVANKDSIEVGLAVAASAQPSPASNSVQRPLPDPTGLKFSPVASTGHAVVQWDGCRPVVVGQQLRAALWDLSHNSQPKLSDARLVTRLRKELRHSGIPFTVQPRSGNAAELVPMPTFTIPGHNGIWVSGATRRVESSTGVGLARFENDLSVLALAKLLQGETSIADLVDSLTPGRNPVEQAGFLNAWLQEISTTLDRAGVETTFIRGEAEISLVVEVSPSFVSTSKSVAPDALSVLS